MTLDELGDEYILVHKSQIMYNTRYDATQLLHRSKVFINVEVNMCITAVEAAMRPKNIDNMVDEATYQLIRALGKPKPEQTQPAQS